MTPQSTVIYMYHTCATAVTLPPNSSIKHTELASRGYAASHNRPMQNRGLARRKSQARPCECAHSSR